MNQQEQHIIDQLAKREQQMPSADYFAQLKQSTLAQTRTAKVIPLYKKWWVMSSAAAGIALIIFVSLFGNQPEAPVTAQNDWSSVSEEDMLAYIEENIADFETEEIVSSLEDLPDWKTQVEIPETTTKMVELSEETEKLFDELDKEDILDYLQEEVVDIDDESITGY